jgi:hypothetical protein
MLLYGSAVLLHHSAMPLCDSAMLLHHSAMPLCDSAMLLYGSAMPLCDSAMLLHRSAVLLCDAAQRLCDSALQPQKPCNHNERQDGQSVSTKVPSSNSSFLLRQLLQPSAQISQGYKVQQRFSQLF